MELDETAKVEEEDTIGRVGDLTELLVEGFDSEQVWQELELQNEPLYEHLTDLTEALLEDGDEVDLESDFLGAAEDEEGSHSDSFEESEEDGVSGESGSAMESDGSMDEGDEEAALQAKQMRAAIRANGEKEERSTSKRRHPLDDQFFNFDDMARFADEGETGGGLLTGANDSDDEDIYSMMYGGGDDGDDSDHEPKKKKKKRQHDDMADLDPEERKLEQALNKKRKTLDMDDDDEEGDDLFGSEGSDVDAEDAYFEDFFAEPTARRGGGHDSESDEEMPELEELSENDESGSLMDASEDDMDVDEDEEDEEEAGLSSHQKAQREQEKKIRKMEREMLSENKRDDATMTSTGDLGVSSFEMHQRHLQKKTEKFEDELVGKKRWTFGGEVKARQRGTNTLLEEDLDFEMATKAAPIISAEVTKSLEDTIKRRIVDRVFDDPIRRLEKPVRGDYRDRAPDLDQEKSKKSLSQIMEDEYVQQTQGGAATSQEDKMPEQHKECLQLFKSICMRMDALANAHFTPLKVKEELDVVPFKDAAAIRLEEVTPATVSNATLLAPEELYKTTSKGDVRGESEWTTEEKRAQRRERKKQHAKARAEDEVEKRREAILHPERKKKTTVAEALQVIAKGPNTTISKNSDRTHYTSSTAFQKITEANAAPSSATPTKVRKY